MTKYTKISAFRQAKNISHLEDARNRFDFSDLCRLIFFPETVKEDDGNKHGEQAKLIDSTRGCIPTGDTQLPKALHICIRKAKT